ncbi:hypothetical protein [Leptolyngbya sp. FACHB-17]|uniref:hypothetical protein n=1 Tax=Leptolyngbya sp. FACHB-17 TaxID=2692803 RepID=UPI00167FF036|nr:hypothetical protein [Leptolyngbya sp. FACHB-17]MBD2080049.1 hypothetical protein [Leptolyngbya sp. FACHB-17]
MTKKKALFTFGAVFTILFCLELSFLGWSNLHSVLSNLQDHHKPFPNQLTRLRINLEFIGATIVYILWLIQKQKENFPSFNKILSVCALFLVVPFLTYPRTFDIYQYLHYGLMGLAGVNPYLNSADSFSSSLSSFLAWSQSSTYGPVSQLIFMAAAAVVKVNLVAGIYFFKLLCLIFHAVNGFLVWALLKNSAWRSKITIAYLVNPLLLTEHLLCAHIDVFVANALLLLLLFLQQRKYSLLVLMVWLGFLEKTLPIIWLPFVFSFLLLNRRWKDIGVSILTSIAVILVVSLTALPTIEAWRSLLNPGVTDKTALSFHYLLSASLSYFPGMAIETKQNLLSLFTRLTTLGFAAFYGITLLKSYLKRRYSETNLISDIGWVTLVLILFATPWVMPWYASILLPIAAVNLTSPVLALASLAFSLSSNLIYRGAGSGVSIFSILSTLTVLLPPIVVLVFGSRLRHLELMSRLMPEREPSLKS